MASSSNVAQRIQNAKRKSANILEKGAKVEARLLGPKTKLDLIVATMNALEMKKERLLKKGGAGSGEKIRKINERRAKLAVRRAKLEKRVAPLLERIENMRGKLEKHAHTVERLGGG